MNGKKLATMFMTVTLSIGMLVGCGKKTFDLEKYGENALVTVDGSSLSFWEANFQARLLQTQYENTYGLDVWTETLEQNETFETSVKNTVLEGLKRNLVVLNHAKDYDITVTDEEKKAISGQVDTFLEQITDEFKELTKPEQEKVENYLEETVMIQKVASAVAKEADVTVTDEEARQMKANYVVFSFDSTDSDSQKANAKNKAQKLVSGAKKINSLAQAANKVKLEVKEATYGANNENIPAEILEASMKLKKNEITEPIETEYGYYVIQCMEYNDKKATKAAKEDILTEKQMEYYNTVSEKWVKEADVKVDEELWNTIAFANHPTISEVESTTTHTTEESNTSVENEENKDKNSSIEHTTEETNTKNNS